MECSLRANMLIVSLCTWGSFYKNNHCVLGENVIYLAICHVSSISRFGDTDEDEKEDAQSPNHCQWKDQCEEI